MDFLLRPPFPRRKLTNSAYFFPSFHGFHNHMIQWLYSNEAGDCMNRKLLMETKSGVFLLKNAFNQESNWRSDNCYKFIFSLNGTIHYQTNRHDVTIDEQQFILFNPEEDHKQLAIDDRK